MRIDEEVCVLRGRLEELESGSACIGDWHRLVARSGRVLIQAQNEAAYLQRVMLDLVTCDPPAPRWFVEQAKLAAFREQIDELRLLRMCAESRVFELEAEAMQRETST